MIYWSSRLKSLVGNIDKLIREKLPLKAAFTFWKVLAEPPIMRSRVKAIEFPILFAKEAQSISSYWDETPNPDHLHLIVQMRRMSRQIYDNPHPPKGRRIESNF